ncbi:MAG: TetR/AcrR family transcriptional regulator [Actinomycetota bacterium]|nr:TetR/AcrR family transcriptional regulator [Actinomycetota bacterium]
MYRRFSSREELLGQLVAREARQFIARIDEQIGNAGPPQDRLVLAFLIFVRSLRSHDLVQRLLVTDPDRVLPLLTTGGNAALTLGRDYIMAQARGAQAAGATLSTEPEYVAEILIRLAHSLVLTPETVLPVEDEPRLAELARATLVPLVFAGSERAGERDD